MKYRAGEQQPPPSINIRSFAQRLTAVEKPDCSQYRCLSGSRYLTAELGEMEQGGDSTVCCVIQYRRREKCGLCHKMKPPVWVMSGCCVLIIIICPLVGSTGRNKSVWLCSTDYSHGTYSLSGISSYHNPLPKLVLLNCDHMSCQTVYIHVCPDWYTMGQIYNVLQNCKLGFWCKKK